MRQYLKHQCFKTIDILKEAHQEIKKFIDKRKGDIALSLLEQCQQGAISLGNFLDSQLGEGTEQVEQLEEYCELVYQLSVDIGSGSSVNAHKWAKRLDKLLTRVANSIRNDLPTETEIVFLPYKASMWDSLESEWKKADADENCTALVVPIPYYDKNPDGSVRAVHYEADQYPSYVPVTDYKTYDLEARHPDKIYIHNPYDSANYVTSVLPQFYSDKLKEYTDDLIYIPYYVLGEPDPDDEKSLEGMERFVTTPGVFNAHHVIVQSEAMRKAYIKVLVKYAGDDTKSYWENKISGAGSPKMNRVENLRKEDFELPEEWQRLVRKQDGSRRKIIFYNTGVSALLENDEKMIRKIRENFDIFRSHADEVTLLWRPHPLIEATLTSMRPQLAAEYKLLKEQYISDGWGIYDDTAELDRAIAVSDAYYGDMSSVVWLYQKTKKPVMIQNCEI